MERMKIEIEKSEYDRLKSREEKLIAYYEWFVDKENDLATVEDIVNENIELHNTLEDIYKENRELRMDKARLKALSKHKTDMVMGLGKLKDELEEENKELKSELDYVRTIKESAEERIKELEEENKKLKATINSLGKIIDKLREELSAYDREYFDEDKKAKNIFMEEDTLQELRDLGKI